MKRILMAALVPAMVVGCSEANKPQLTGSEDSAQLFQHISANLITIKTMDDKAVANAQVLIGDAQNSPFAGNLLTTNAVGQIEVPAGWNQALPVTVQAPGFIRSTYMSVEPGSLTIQLRPLNTVTQYQIKGAATGLPIKNGDDQVDFGLVMPAFTKLQLFAFNMDNVISPQSDIVSAMGQEIQVPVNLSLPKQSEKYSLFTITLDKPAYRIYLGQPGVQRVFVAKGRFPFKATVDQLKDGKQFWELINSFKLSGGAVRDLNITGGQTALDMPTGEMNFGEAKSITAPQFRADEAFMAAAVANQSGYMFPTDVKKMTAGQKASLNTLGGTPANVLAVLKKTDDWKNGGDRVSTAMVPFDASVAPQVLPLMDNPTVAGGGRELTFPQISTIGGVIPTATYTVLSMEIEVQQGPEKVKLMNPTWEIYSAKWVTSMKVPTLPGDNFGNGKKRWEVNFLGSQNSSQPDMGPAMIEQATHVTHSSATF